MQHFYNCENWKRPAGPYVRNWVNKWGGSHTAGYHAVIKSDGAGQSLWSARPRNLSILLPVFSIFEIKTKRFRKHVFVNLLKIIIINPFHVLLPPQKKPIFLQKNNFIVQNKKSKIRWMALFYTLANLFKLVWLWKTAGFACLLLHWSCWDITHRAASGRLRCAPWREWEEMANNVFVLLWT